MKDLLLELLPHAPHLGLYTAPNIPDDKLQNALGDYAKGIRRDDVLALYDATLLGNARDGAVFTADRLIFQNNNLEPAHTVRYGDIVAVDSKRKLLGGRKVTLNVNRGRATISLSIDFSGKPDAASFAERFLNEAMVRGAANEMDRPDQPPDLTASGSDKAVIRSMLEDLRTAGTLTDSDYRTLADVLEQL